MNSFFLLYIYYYIYIIKHANRVVRFYKSVIDLDQSALFCSFSFFFFFKHLPLIFLFSPICGKYVYFLFTFFFMFPFKNLFFQKIWIFFFRTDCRYRPWELRPKKNFYFFLRIFFSLNYIWRCRVFFWFYFPKRNLF